MKDTLWTVSRFALGPTIPTPSPCAVAPPPDATEAYLVRALALSGFSAETGTYRRLPLLDGPARAPRVRRSGTPEDAEADLDEIAPTFDVARPRVYWSGRLLLIAFGADTDLPATRYPLLGSPL